MSGEDFLKFNNGKEFRFSNFKEIKEEDLKGVDEKTKKIFNIFAGEDKILQSSEAQSLFNSLKSVAGKDNTLDENEIKTFSEVKLGENLDINNFTNFVNNLFGKKETQTPVIDKEQQTFLEEKACKDIALNVIDENISEAFEILNSQYLGAVTGWHDDNKDKNDILKTSNVSKVLEYQNAGVEWMERAKIAPPDGLTKREYYEENKNRIKDMILTRINVLNTNTGFNELKKQYSEKQLAEIIGDYVERLCSNASMKELKDIQKGFVSFRGVKEIQAIEKVVHNAIDYHNDKKNLKPVGELNMKVNNNPVIPEYWDSNEPISFEEVYEIERGTEYSQYKIENYALAKKQMEVVANAYNKKQQFIEFSDSLINDDNLNSEQKTQKILEGFEKFYSLSPDGGKSQLEKLIKESKLPISLGKNGIDFGTLDENTKNRALNSLLKLAKQSKEAEFEKFLNGKTIEDYQKDLMDAHNDAIGEENSKMLAEAMKNDNMTAIQRWTGGASMVGMGMTVVGGILCFTPLAPLGAGMVYAGNTLAIGGMVAETGLGVADYATKDVQTKEEAEQLGKNFLMNAGGFIVGIGAGKAGMNAFNKLVDKKLVAVFGKEIAAGNKMQALKEVFTNPDNLKSFMTAAGAKLSTDFVISYAGDLAMMGVLDTNDNWQSLLKANLTGILVGMSGDIKDVSGVGRKRNLGVSDGIKPLTEGDYAQKLLGNDVTVKNSQTGKLANGSVTGVQVDGGKVVIEVDGKKYYTNDVTEVKTIKSTEAIKTSQYVSGKIVNQAQINIPKGKFSAPNGKFAETDGSFVIKNLTEEEFNKMLPKAKEKLGNAGVDITNSNIELNQYNIQAIDRLIEEKVKPKRIVKMLSVLNEDNITFLEEGFKLDDNLLMIEMLGNIDKNNKAFVNRILALPDHKFDKIDLLFNINQQNSIYVEKMLKEAGCASDYMSFLNSIRQDNEKYVNIILDQKGNILEKSELLRSINSSNENKLSTILNLKSELSEKSNLLFAVNDFSVKYLDHILELNGDLSSKAQLLHSLNTSSEKYLNKILNLDADLKEKAGILASINQSSKKFLNNVLELNGDLKEKAALMRAIGSIPEASESTIFNILNKAGDLNIKTDILESIKINPYSKARIDQILNSIDSLENGIAQFLKAINKDNIDFIDIILNQKDDFLSKAALLKAIKNENKQYLDFVLTLSGDLNSKASFLRAMNAQNEKYRSLVLKLGDSLIEQADFLRSIDIKNEKYINKVLKENTTLNNKTILMEEITSFVNRFNSLEKEKFEHVIKRIDFVLNQKTDTESKISFINAINSNNEKYIERVLAEEGTFANKAEMLKVITPQSEKFIDFVFKQDFSIKARASLLGALKDANEKYATNLVKNYKKMEILPENLGCLIKNYGEISPKQIRKLYRVMGQSKVSKLSDSDLLIATKMVDIYGKTNINEISQDGKKTLLRNLVDCNEGLFNISDDLRKHFPLIPTNREDYCSLLPSIVRSMGIETNILKPKEIEQFNKSMTDLSTSLAKISDQDFTSMSITQEYSKNDFMQKTLEIVKDMDPKERQKVYDYFGFELHHQGVFSLVGKPIDPKNETKLAQITNIKTQNAIKDLSLEIEKFSIPENKDGKIYSNDEFIRKTHTITKGLSRTERNKVYDYFGFSLKHELSITGYPVNLNNGKKLAQITDPKTKDIVEKLRPEVIRFSQNNHIKCDNPEVEKFLNEVVKDLPELRAQIGKVQHGTHSFDIMKHSLKVMQKITQDPKFNTLDESDRKIMMLASLLHDITKAEGLSDKTHATQGGFDISFIARKFDLQREDLIKLYTLSRNHEWLEFVNTSKTEEELTKRLQSVAYDLQYDNLFEMAQIFTHADLKAVKGDDSFHDSTVGKSRASFDNDGNRVFEADKGTKVSHGEAVDRYATRINEYINELKKSQPILPVTKIPKASRINEAITVVHPNGSTNIKGVYKNPEGLVVIKFNEVEDWEAIGFPKGSISRSIKAKGGSTTGNQEFLEDVNTGNIKFFAHALEYENQLAKFDAFSLIDSDVLLSISYAERPESKFRFFKTQGILLDFDTKYIHGGGNTDAGSGYGKFIEQFKREYIFGGHRESDRVYVSNLIKDATGMNDAEYIKFVEKNKNKALVEIEPKELQEVLVKAYASINSNTRKGARSYNEMYGSNPKEVMATFAYSEDSENAFGHPFNVLQRENTQFLQKYALEHNIPMIVFGD